MKVYKNKVFQKWAKSEGVKDTDLTKAATEIEAGLVDGALGGDVFKKRLARKGQGKRGGFRTIVAFQKGHRIFFMYGFAKNQRTNISEKEEQDLKKLAKFLLDTQENKLEAMIENGTLYEVKP